MTCVGRESGRSERKNTLLSSGRLRLSDGTELLFRGDTRTGDPADFLEARDPPTIRDGEVLIAIEGLLPGSLSQRRVGSFDARLLRSWQSTEDQEAKMTGTL